MRLDFHLFDVRCRRGRRCRRFRFERVEPHFASLAADRFGATGGSGSLSAAARNAVDFIRGCALGGLFLGDQSLPIGNRDLVVVRMNFAKGEKTVAVAAVIDKSGLQRRLDARHFR